MVSKRWVFLLLLVVAALILELGWTYYRGRGGELLERTTLGVAEGPPARAAWAPQGPATAKNLILVVGDGMGSAQIQLARTVTRGWGGRLAMEKMPVVALVSTQAAGSTLTDSAASATALATGCKTGFQRLAVDPEGRTLPTVMEAARDAGLRSGLVTTSYLLDATPASFVAHVENRGQGAEIAAQYLAAGVEVLLGGDGGVFLGEDGDALRRQAQASGYRLVTEPGELDESVRAVLRSGASERLLGLFSTEELILPEAPKPSLAELTTAALDLLERRDPAETGFFLLVEHEGPDTWGHLHEARETVASVEQLDAAVEVALERARRDGETLVVVTADHETGGLTLIGGQDREVKVLWTSGYHTGVPVPLFAAGPGAEAFAGVMDNTQVARRLAAALGLELPPCP